MPLQLLVTFVSREQHNWWFWHAWLDCLLLLFLSSPQLSFMVWNGFSVFLMGFFCSPHLHSLPLTFIDSRVLITQLSYLSKTIKNSTFEEIIFLLLLKPWNLNLQHPILPLNWLYKYEQILVQSESASSSMKWEL